MNYLSVGIVGAVIAVIIGLFFSNKSKSNKLDKAETELKNAKVQNIIADTEKRAQTVVSEEAVKVIASQKENSENGADLRSALRPDMTVEDAVKLAQQQIKFHTERTGYEKN